MSTADDLLALAHSIDAERARDLERELGRTEGRALGVLLGTAFPPMLPVQGWQLQELERVAAAGWRTHRPRDVMVTRLLRAVADFAEPESVHRALRREVWTQKARIALREILPRPMGGADIDVSASELSFLAEGALEVALVEATTYAERRFGEPRRSDGERSTLVVYGMGKLGGRELNAGSDVDLIVFYDTDDGGGDITLHEYWTHVVRRVVSTIESPTADGLVWRVDLRLRPEGSRGPLVYSWAAAERYYETWGRLWERAALLRGRPVAGDRALGESMWVETFAPFVFRRNVDPSIATALAELVQQSRVELSPDPARDLKLGLGGIREAEFFVQALQLIWGGRHPSLRVPGTIAALERLRSQGLVADREARIITDGYRLLRRVEHGVQWQSGTQTHLLPRDERTLHSLAVALGFDGTEAMHQSLAEAREAIAELFASLSPEKPRPPARYTMLLARIDHGPHQELVDLVESHFGEPDMAEHLEALARRPDGLLGDITRARYPEFADQLLDALDSCPDPEQAARYLRSFYGRFTTPAPYVTPLATDPRALARVVTVFGASVFVGDAIVARPDLADGLVFSTTAVEVPKAHEIVQLEVDSFERQAEQLDDPDEIREEFVGALRRAKSKTMVQAAVADLAGELSMRDVTRVLSEVADEVLEQAVRFELGGETRGLSVIAVGKLGGRDIGYGSDLDVLFIYDPDAAPEGKDPPEFFTRRAQRIIRLISSPHVAGPGYELDTRLRPSGSQGLLVTSLESFARYHRVRLDDDKPESVKPAVLSSGAAWERQALLRARVAAGDRALGERLIAVSEVAAYERGAPPSDELHRLRMRMEKELAHERRGRYDLKAGRGGLLDIEFATQWLQMRHGKDFRVRTTDTLEALRSLKSAGYLAPRDFETFHHGYEFLRRLEQRIRVLHGSGAPTIDVGAPGLEKLARRMGIVRTPDQSEQDVLLESYREITDRVRRTYLKVLGVE